MRCHPSPPHTPPRPRAAIRGYADAAEGGAFASLKADLKLSMRNMRNKELTQEARDGHKAAVPVIKSVLSQIKNEQIQLAVRAHHPPPPATARQDPHGRRPCPRRPTRATITPVELDPSLTAFLAQTGHARASSHRGVGVLWIPPPPPPPPPTTPPQGGRRPLWAGPSTGE